MAEGSDEISGAGNIQSGPSTISGAGAITQINLEEVAAEQNIGNEDVSPKDKLALAKGVLFFIFILAILAGVARVFAEVEAGKDIFDAATTLLLPVVTLVLGFYFGRNDNNQTS